MNIKDQKKIVENLLNKKENQLKPDDKFQFKCTACGKCCWNIDVLINCYDMIRLRNGLKLTTKEIFQKDFVDFYLGPSSGLPVLRLNFLKMGDTKVTHCPFLMPAIDIKDALKKIEEKAQGNKEEMKNLIEQIKTDPKNAAKILSGIKIDRWVCSIHKNRPIICRLYPCGRFQQIEKKTGEREEMFMLQTDQKGFCPGFEEKETTTLKDYLSSQGFGEHQEGSNLFSKILNLLTSNGFYAMTEENKNSDIKPLFSPNSHVIVFLGNLIYNFDSFNTFSEDPRVIKTIYDENSTQDDFLYVENKIFDVVKGFVELMQKKPSMNDFKSFVKTLANKT